MRALVLGSAVSGKPAARLLGRRGVEAEVYDRRPAALEPLREDGFGVHSGKWNPRLLRDVDVVVTSPGVPQHAAPIEDAITSGIPVWSELELGARHLGIPMAAVTGTNGKTTVTRLVTEMLTGSGIAATSAGNIGEPLTGLVLDGMDDPDDRHWDVVVVEASSFQLRFIDEFHPAAAVILNVAPDHLDWHGSEDAYLAAKANIWRNQTEDDLLVYDADDPGAVRAVAGAAPRPVPVSGLARADGGGPDGGRVWFGDGSVDLGELPALDPAYLVDLIAAAVVAAHFGASERGIGDAMKRFQPGAHRRALVGEWDGVAWVDDSKATNPHAAIASAGAFTSVILIAGGRSKDLDLSPLPSLLSVKHTFAIGEAAAELVAAGGRRVTAVDSLEDAVAAADELATSGDTVLLAPGCASFDMFESYQERGDAFAGAVRRRKEAS